MSMELYVCWRGELEADRSKLEGALDSLGFDATVLHDFEHADGFWPIDIAGCKTGVEIYHDYDLRNLCELMPELGAALDGRDRVVTFTWGGDPAECGTALALAAALAQLGNVVIYEPSEGVVFSADRAVDEARRMFGSAKSEGYSARED